mgnify:CR=1 FL=1
MKRMYILILLFLSTSFTLLGQLEDQQIIRYLQKHSFNIEQRKIDKPVRKKLKNASLIALGEIHGTQISYEALSTLLEAITRFSPIDYYLVELDFSSSHFINEYLKSGDEKYLDLVFSHFDGTFFYNESLVESFKKIRDNGLLKNLKTIGTDIYHVPLTGIRHLNSVIDINNLKHEDLPHIHALLSLPFNEIGYRNPDFIKLLQSSIKELEENKAFIAKLPWANAYSEMEYILKTMDISFQIKKADEEKQDSLRDDQMFENFRKLREQSGVKPSDKLFFFGGREHIIKAELPYANKFISLMDRHLYPGKTVSISMFYAQSLFMIPNEQFGIEGEGKFSEKNFFNDNGPFFETDNINLLIEASGNSNIKGFDLSRKKSPFATGNIFTKQYSSEHPTLKFFDFVIMIKNSKATLSLKK